MNRDRRQELTERDRRDLVALADAALPARRQAALKARLASSPALRAGLDGQRRAAGALRAIEVGAPARLRTTLAAERPAAARRFAPLAWAGAAAAVAALAVAIVLLAGGASAPTVDQAAGLASLPATAPAPGPRADQPTLLNAEAEGLAYPNWDHEFGWRARGERADELGDREATTVLYRNADGNRLAYTIVSGSALESEAGADSATVDGVELSVSRDGDRTVVTWLRDGHTCVLSGSGVPRRTMLELAAWKGDGAVAF
jgi:hypothetical protein